MDLCDYCSNIDYRLTDHPYRINPTSKLGHYKHHPNLASLTHAARSGCELCDFFLKCAEERPHSTLEEVQKGGQLYICDTVSGGGAIACDLSDPCNPITARGYLCVFECLASLNNPSYEKEPPPFIDFSSDSSSNTAFAKIKIWLAECFTNHPACGKPIDEVLPTRILDVGISTDHYIRLVTTNGSRGSWIALSHCWGKSVPLQTKRDSLVEMQRGISEQSLPATFQDAVHITRRLGFRYLWIDSLCIIQDSSDDWNQESGRMAEIYSNCTLTISAEAATDSTFGIFASANVNRPRNFLKVKCRWNVFGLEEVWFRSSISPPSYESFHLHDRAWTLQEMLLPSRVLSYTSLELRYMCCTTQWDELMHGSTNRVDDQNLRIFKAKQILCSVSPPQAGSMMVRETSNKDLTVLEKPPTSGEESTAKSFTRSNSEANTESVLGQWYRIVEGYAEQQLTFEKDRLSAIAGLAKRVSQLTGYSYKAGLWNEDLVRGLAWRVTNVIIRDQPPIGLTVPCLNTVPSWSWASIPATALITSSLRVEFPLLGPFRVAEDTKVLEIQLDYPSNDPYLEVSAGGSIKITARCCSWEKARGWSYFFSPEIHWSDSPENRREIGSDLLLLLGSTEHRNSKPTDFALVLRASDVQGRYKRVGLRRRNRNYLRSDSHPLNSSFEHWPVQNLTII